MLREHGPLGIEELGRRMAEMGATRARDPLAAARDTVQYDRRLVGLRDGRWMDRVAALDGAVLTHRTTRHERRLGAVRFDPDLSVLGTVVTAGEITCTDGPVSIVTGWTRDRRLPSGSMTPDRYLTVPYGLARRFRPGHLIAVVVSDGTLSIDLGPVASQGSMPDPDALEAVATHLLGTHGLGDTADPVAIEDLLFEALGHHPDLLRAGAIPVGEMLRRCDLATNRDLVGVPLTDWNEYEYRSEVWRTVHDTRWRAEMRAIQEQGPAEALTTWYDITLPVID